MAGYEGILRPPVEESDRHTLITIEEILERQRESGFSKWFFGMRMIDAMQHGFRVSRRGYSEATNSLRLVVTAQTIGGLLLTAQGVDGLPIVSLCDGSGQPAWALTKTGRQVIAVELDRFTHEYAQHNLRVAGV